MGQALKNLGQSLISVIGQVFMVNDRLALLAQSLAQRGVRGQNSKGLAEFNG